MRMPFFSLSEFIFLTYDETIGKVEDSTFLIGLGMEAALNCHVKKEYVHLVVLAYYTQDSAFVVFCFLFVTVLGGVFSVRELQHITIHAEVRSLHSSKVFTLELFKILLNLKQH